MMGTFRGCALLVTIATVGCSSEVTESAREGSGTSGGMGGTVSAGGASASGGAVEGPGAILDSNQVYLVSMIEEGTCNSTALVHWDAADVVSFGFDCYCEFWDAAIRPTDGRMLMRCHGQGEDEHNRVVREFHCDECPYVHDPVSFPENVLDNDPILPNPCPEEVRQFKLTPEGLVLYDCAGVEPTTWRDETGVALFEETSTDRVVHAGYGGQLLTTKRLVELGSSSGVDLVGLPEAPIVAARAVASGGFLVVVYVGQGDGADDHDDHELWQVDASGVGMLLGVYPPAPGGYHAVWLGGRLESSGALLQLATAADSTSHVILRREVGASSEVVYSDESGPLVKLYIGSSLVTAP